MLESFETSCRSFSYLLLSFSSRMIDFVNFLPVVFEAFAMRKAELLEY